MEQIKIVMAEGCHDLVPHKAHHDDAGFDLYSREDVIVAPGKRALIKTGLFIELPYGYEAQVRPRSGLAIKHGITVVNSPGTVDAGYRGEVGVILLNTDTDEAFHITRGERIAQMVIQTLPEVELKVADALTETKRGEGGFGSTKR